MPKAATTCRPHVQNPDLRPPGHDKDALCHMFGCDPLPPRVTPPGGGSSREPVTQPLTLVGRWGHPARSMAPNPSPTRGRWDLTSRRGIPRMDESAACIQRQTLAQRRGRTRDASCTKDPKASMEAASTGGVETNVNSLDVTPLPRNPGRPGTGILILADHEQARARTARDLGDRGVGA